MKMNIKQQYLLRLLGLEKKGALTDFEAFAFQESFSRGRYACLV